jgi:hypothetical protein
MRLTTKLQLFLIGLGISLLGIPILAHLYWNACGLAGGGDCASGTSGMMLTLTIILAGAAGLLLAGGFMLMKRVVFRERQRAKPSEQ